MAGLAKMHNTRKARAITAEARDMHGGNGILLDYQVMLHMVDLEAVHTFEGTETMQTLIVGRADHRPRRLRIGEVDQLTITTARSDKIPLEQNGRWFTVLRRIAKTSGCQGPRPQRLEQAATGSRTM